MTEEPATAVEQDDGKTHDDRCVCDDCMPWEPGYEGHGYWGVDD